MKYFLLILGIVILFFNQIFFGKIPFPGDLLINENPYRTQSFQGYNPGSFPNKAQGQDIISEIYPWRFFSVDQLKHGQIPFWNPYNFSGNYQFANFQTAVFYPLNFLYFLFPFNFAWTAIIMLSPLLGALFMFLFLRELKLSEFSSFLGGIAFAFSSYMIVWMEYGNINHAMIWLPLVLLFVKRIVNKLNAINFLGLSAVLTLSIIAGYVQGVFYLYLISFLYFLFLIRSSNKKSKKIFFFFISLIFPFFLASFQLIPTITLFAASTRGQYSDFQISNLLLPIYYWVTVFVPDFFGNPATRNYYIPGTYIEKVSYVGVPILFFAFISVLEKFREKLFFFLLAIISLLVATNLPFVKLLYKLPIPVISTTVPTRELSIFIFCVIVLGAFGINSWEKKRVKAKIPIIFLSLYLLFFVANFLLFKNNILSSQNFSIALRNLFFPSAIALSTFIIFFFFRKTLGKILLTALLVFDLFYFFNKITPFSSTEFVYPKTPVITFLQKTAGINRYWGYGSAYIEPNFQTFDKTYTPEGEDPLHIGAYGILLASTANGKIPEVLPRPDANIVPGFGSEDLSNNFYRQRILNLLGVKYVLNKNFTTDYDNIFPREKYSLVWQETPWQVYENKEALPRFFMTNDYKVSSGKLQVLNSIYDKNLDLVKTLLLEEEPQIKIDNSSNNLVKLLSYTPNKVTLSTESSGNSLLFLSDNYASDWKGTIDSKSSKILVADYTFRAIAVPKGKHIVEFSYNPKYFLTGLKISLFSLAAFLLLTLYLKRNEKK